MLYDPNAILQQISEHVPAVLLLGGLALVFNFVYFIEMARRGFKDRCAVVPLWALVLFLPHDGSYLLRFDTWFNGYSHWFPKMFWLGLVITFSLELVYFGLMIRFGRNEFAPRLSQRTWTLYCLGALAAGVIGWQIVKENLSDDLYLLTFMVTILMCGPANGSLMMRRTFRQGTSLLVYIGYTGMAICYAALTVIVLGGNFRSVTWIILSAVAVSYGLVLAVAVTRLPQPAPASDSLPEKPAVAAN